ncbi:hypothetical protein [Demequina sp. NBRC 110056]|uniref:hypothetical protein n=1 Tax=Demequina sp. NBRC 110056 TaxID=1570345 RepID=UPI00117DD1D8|nr:hypothetical protein [Demequina sp. NBRC 110056]
MVAYRSRQLSFQNRLACAALLGSLALCVVLFTVSGAWAELPWLAVGCTALLAALLFVPLTITVDETAVHVSLAGVLKRSVPLGEVTAVETRDYRPIREFGGWGWRWAFDRRASAYATRGTSAVVLSLADGSEVYLGVDDEPGLVDAVSVRIAA